MLKWYEKQVTDGDVVISSRIRLARNLNKYPFSAKINKKEAEDLVKKVQTVAGILSEDANMPYHSCSLNGLEDIDKIAMVERHIVSPLLIKKDQAAGLILSNDESVSIMINEEDHVRIQVIEAGMNLNEAYKKASKIDDLSDGELSYAFDKKYGYLTTCPTNVGTGLRASYMVFLPALSSAKMIPRLVEEVGKFGVTIRGIYGEGTKSLGNIYQISNQKTIGNTEREIIDNLNRIVIQVVNQERKRREYILSVNYDELKDRVYRAYGVLKYTRQISSIEAMSLLSQIKFGLHSELIEFQDEINIHQLMMGIQPGNLQWGVGKTIAGSNREKARADYIRKSLPNVI